MELGGEIMVLVQVKPKSQITLPFKIRKELNIKERDYLGVDIQGNKIVMIPQVVLNKSVKLTKKGEARLKKALEEVKAGKVKKFENVEELISDLRK